MATREDRSDEPGQAAQTSAPPQSNRPPRLGAVLWAAFLTAGVMEMLIFAVVDPADLHWFGGEALDLPREAVYTVTFFVCWIVTSLSAGLAVLMAEPADEINRRSLAKYFP